MISILHQPFYFMRHGETDWNRQHVYMGSKDIPLNKNGIKQAERAAQLLKDEPITQIISSPLLRATKTAEIIASVIQVPITIIEDLKECHWGIMEGQSVLSSDKDILQLWLKGEHHEGAESVHEFTNRVQKGFLQALKIPGPILIIAHGGIYCAIQRILNWPYTPDLANCVPIFHTPPKQPTHPWTISDLAEGKI